MVSTTSETRARSFSTPTTATRAPVLAKASPRVVNFSGGHRRRSSPALGWTTTRGSLFSGATCQAADRSSSVTWRRGSRFTAPAPTKPAEEGVRVPAAAVHLERKVETLLLHASKETLQLLLVFVYSRVRTVDPCRGGDGDRAVGRTGSFGEKLLVPHVSKQR